MKKKLTIGHLSHGITLTGGYLLEQNLLNALVDYFRQKGTNVEHRTQRANQYFSGLSHFKLLAWGFKQTTNDINIVVARCALSSIVRNWFSNRKTIIVLHNFDETDGKNVMLRWYFKLLFTYLSYTQSKQIAIVTVAPFWVEYFQQKIKFNIPVLLFPNLFDVQKYFAYQTNDKRRQIHLGQYSTKNNNRIYELAARLRPQGYTCYFTTLNESEKGVYPDYEVRYVSYEQYLKEMAESEYTLAYIGINEGWNRIAHESILVGTHVIGVNKGGLGNLLTESGSLIADSVSEFYNAIVTHTNNEVSPGFIQKYDIKNAGNWITPIGLFCDTQ